MIENNVAVYCETKEDAYLFLEWLVNNTNILWGDGSCIDPKEKDEIRYMSGYVIQNNRLYFSAMECDFNSFKVNYKFSANYSREFTVINVSDIIGKFYNMPSKESLMDFLCGEEND